MADPDGRGGLLAEEAEQPADSYGHPPVEGPTWAQIRAKVNQLAAERGVFGGAPIPIERLRLCVERKYEFQGLNGCKLGNDDDLPELPELAGYRCVNAWLNKRHQVYVCILQNATGRAIKSFLTAGPSRRLEFALHTLDASQVWDIDTEIAALGRLRTYLSEWAFDRYVLTGSFIETSKRSGVVYMFRRLRPTLAIRTDESGSRLLAALCLHPIGYYEESWAGSMCPTDDVIAHLLLMRADERKFWSQANQHGPNAAEAGV